MKKEIYITIFLFALMLFALAVTVVSGYAIDSGSTKKIHLQGIIKGHQLKKNLILPVDGNRSNIAPLLEIPTQSIDRYELMFAFNLSSSSNGVCRL